jgi:rubredoxin
MADNAGQTKIIYMEVFMVWECSVCGYRYEEDVEKVPFDQLPDDWTCPICNAPKSAFEKSAT